ncbi:hypothetical protein L0337_37595 [candidate division KSB1 bacterium]|nr:hypothetical protein [candidate division KSB1 bacterium]
MFPPTQEKSTTRIVPVETGYKIQIPLEWAVEFGLESSVAAEKTATGIWVRPCRTLTWDEVFANKLSIGKQSLAKDLSELSGDDLLF